MRPKIVNLDVDLLEWKPLGPAGLYSRELSRDPDTGARTALQRLCPADNYTPPTVAHYHHTYEEILGISGCFSFDSKLWVEPCTYVFHPPQTVHGFKSAIREESTFLSRVGRDLDFNFVEEPEQDVLYSVSADVLTRPAAVLSAEANLKGFVDGQFLGANAKIKLLSQDEETGEGSALVELSQGWSSNISDLTVYLEMFILQGKLSLKNVPPIEGRGYFFYPPNEALNELSAEETVLVYVNFGGDIDL